MTSRRTPSSPLLLPPLLVLPFFLLPPALLAPRSATAQELAHDVPFVTTPMKVVGEMLELARPAAGDSVYDLGAGDGRINVEAARRFGAPGVGFEIEPRLVERARERAREAGVEDVVDFREQDLFEADLRPASVVTLYLLWAVNYRLRPKLFRELRPGARVVSHKFDMGQWEPDSVVHTTEPRATVYYWVIPANVAGHWRVALPDGDTVLVELTQKFQELRGRVVSGSGESGAPDVGSEGSGWSLEEAHVEGEAVRIVLRAGSGTPGRENELTLRGTVAGDRAEGRTADGTVWSAVRVFGGGQPLDRWDPDGG